MRVPDLDEYRRIDALMRGLIAWTPGARVEVLGAAGVRVWVGRGVGAGGLEYGFEPDVGRVLVGWGETFGPVWVPDEG
ncbi:hypothetical protein QD712_36485 [Streptomyces acidiscabies]|uniref:hypothetical protein n=1 Tax=Streptomyces acidiscabies TaxID=42234 RepID=UPI0030CB7E7A